MLGRTLTGRMPGVGLSEAGLAEAGRLAARFAAGGGVSAVVSSPLQRAQETAGPIAAALGLGVLTEPGLDEIDFGAWSGVAFAALGGAGWDHWNRFRSMAPTPGGETMLGAQARAVAAAGRLRRVHGAAAVVVVSHQDVLKALLAHWLGMPLDFMQRLELAPGSCSTVRLWDDDVRVDGINVPA